MIKRRLGFFAQAPPPRGCKSESEFYLRSQLKRSRIIGSGYLAEVSIPGIRIDSVELSVVESVEGLEP